MSRPKGPKIKTTKEASNWAKMSLDLQRISRKVQMTRLIQKATMKALTKATMANRIVPTSSSCGITALLLLRRCKYYTTFLSFGKPAPNRSPFPSTPAEWRCRRG